MRTLILLLVVIAVYSISIIVFETRYNERVSDHYEQEFQELDYQLDSLVAIYQEFSDYFYDKLVDNEYVLSSMADAWHGDEVERDQIRSDLYDYLEADYELMTEYNFRQFHFHFPDSTSFLRMHRPDTYGDSLIGVRNTVEYVNEYLVPVAGYEEGKIYNGYRYVYPLLYNGEHVGSVEVSVSLSTVLEMLTELYAHSDYCFIISREVVEAKVFDEELTNYATSYINDAFLYDIETQSCISERNLVSEDELETLFRSMNEDDKEAILTYDYYHFNVEQNDVLYEIILSPLENVEGNDVGYLISVSDDSRLDDLQYSNNINLIILSMLLLIVFVLIFVIEYGRKKLQVLSEVDRLTGIYNRRKFDKSLLSEMERSNRTRDKFSLIMFDIDHFKKVNDTYGHVRGDDVLKTLVTIVGEHIRIVDTFARFGGEEFIIVLTNSDAETAYNKANEIRSLVEQHTFEIVGKITISAGVCEYNNTYSFDDIIKYVDNALYEAKESGRNKVIIYNKVSSRYEKQ
jgi:diguanylate cyclase (GGDEF)-like protein